MISEAPRVKLIRSILCSSRLVILCIYVGLYSRYVLNVRLSHSRVNYGTAPLVFSSPVYTAL